MADQLAVATLARIRRQMAEADLDWLLLGSPANVAYATGYRSVAGDIFPAHQMAALVGTDELVLIAPAADVGAATEYLSTDHLEPFGTFFFESAHSDQAISTIAGRNDHLGAALASAIRRFGVTGRLGADTALLDHPTKPLATAIDSSVAPIESWMRQVRSTKLPGEVRRLTQAARLAEDGIQAALATARAGTSERELAQVVSATMIAGGGMPRFVVVTSGVRSALSDARPTDRTWQPGELLRFDVGCTFRGYWSDIGRTAVLGEPDQLTASRYEAIKAGEDAQLRAARPGLAAGTLYDIAMETVRESGLRPYRRHHCGHGIGREVYEPPGVTPGSADTLEAGMVLCLETPFYEIGWGGMMVEDTVAITASGNQLLNVSDRSLRIVDP